MDGLIDKTLRILEGGADYHLHTAPDPNNERIADAFEAADGALSLGIRALGFKCHAGTTGAVASMVGKRYPDMTVVGTIVLNREVGGINPLAVETDARLGTRKVCMPTTWSTLARRQHNIDDAVRVTSEDGEVLPEVRDVLSLSKEKDLIIETGHLWEDEIVPLFKAAKEIGVTRFVVTHASKIEGRMLDLALQQQLASEGALIEHCFGHIFPLLGNIGVDRIAKCIRHVGAESCILSTDLGQAYNPTPWEGMKMAVSTMLKSGFSEREVTLLVKDNPLQMLIP